MKGDKMPKLIPNEFDVFDYEYVENQEQVHAWLAERGLLDAGVFRLVRDGDHAIAHRYTNPPRVDEAGELVLADPVRVPGWPLDDASNLRWQD